MPGERARKCYDFKFKETVIKHAEENSSQEAARKYSAIEAAVSIWVWFLFIIFFHLNCGFFLRAAFIREDKVLSSAQIFDREIAMNFDKKHILGM